MTVTTTARKATVSAPFAFKGRNAVVRNAALAGVATFAYAEGTARADIVARLKAALGNKPSADEVAACARQYVIGRAAQKLAADECMKGKSVAEMIAFATLLVTSYASPLKDGVKAKKLRKGQLGRRSVAQHKAIRASEEAWSQLKAEVVPALSNAQTQTERNGKKRSTNSNPVRGAGKAGAGLTHSELVKPDGKPHTKESATEYVGAMAATLLAFSNKHAKVMPSAYGTAIVAFKKAIEAAAKLD
jgi:hypothetical protein